MIFIDHLENLMNRGTHDDAVSNRGDVRGNKDGFGPNTNKIAGLPKSVLTNAAIENAANMHRGASWLEGAGACGALPNRASPNNPGVLCEEEGGELMERNFVRSAKEKPSRKSNKLLNEHNGKTVEAVTAASTTSVDSKSAALNDAGGGGFLGRT